VVSLVLINHARNKVSCTRIINIICRYGLYKMTSHPTFGQWLKVQRKALDLTQVDLADQVSCAVETIRKLEADKRRPSRLMAERLADILAIAQEHRTAFIQFARHTHAFSVPHIEPTLPQLGNSFVEHMVEVTTLTEYLSNPACRLISLIGRGGIGKTRLGIEIARRCKSLFVNGVYFVPLIAVNKAEHVFPALAKALKLTVYDETGSRDQVLSYLHEKNALLIFDNFEHLINAAPLLIQILNNAPHTKLVVTSHERLRLQEEWGIELQGLPFPSSVQDTDNWTDFAAARLFYERACQFQPAFSLHENKEFIIKICQYLEGLPLGIEWVTSWLRFVSCQEIATQITYDHSFLVSTLDNVPTRHLSLSALFDHTWRLLSEEERHAIARLSVFQGSFSAKVAGEVANTPLSLIRRLIDKSLVRIVRTECYELHHLLREYANEQLNQSIVHHGTLPHRDPQV
jgi:predicted ATPase/transcriptional regulator with XRE-family HTH domain